MSTFGDSTGQDATWHAATAQDTIPPDNAPHDNTGQDNTGQDNTGQDNTGQARAQAPGGPFGRPGPRRAYHGRMVGGVCAGLGDYLGIDVTIVRVAFAVFAFAGGVGLPAYLACLLLIPEEGSDESIAGAFLGSVQHGRS